MSAKITTLLRDWVIQSKIADPEMIQVWDDSGSIGAEQLPFTFTEGATVVVANDFDVTLFIESMQVTDVDRLKIVVGQFVRYYGHDLDIEWEAPRLNKTDCQALFTFGLVEQMKITKTNGVLSIDYCNAPLDGLL